MRNLEDDVPLHVLRTEHLATRRTTVQFTPIAPHLLREFARTRNAFDPTHHISVIEDTRPVPIVPTLPPIRDRITAAALTLLTGIGIGLLFGAVVYAIRAAIPPY
jgi:hypothetical protein